MSKHGMIQTFERRAKKLIGKKSEKVFLKQQREELLSDACGEILEVAVGRGVNFQFYQPDSKITAVDFSPTLLKMAEENAAKLGIAAEFIYSDVEALKFHDNSFDTIVSTLTLCSYDNPVKVLNNFNNWCRPDGKILLLEHGISANKNYGWMLNKVLNNIDSWCLKNMGDHVNRRILEIIEESDIKVEEIKTCLLDTHYVIWATPHKISVE